jgi:hypothetical protein
VVAEARPGVRLATLHLEGYRGGTGTTAIPRSDGVVLAVGRNNGTVGLWHVAADFSSRPAGTLAAGRHGTAFVAPDGRGYRADGDVSDVLWWAAGLHRFEAGELDAYAAIARTEPWQIGRSATPQGRVQPERPL